MELLEVQKEADSAGRKAVFFGICALVLAGLFGWMLAQLSGKKSGDMQPVVVARSSIPALTTISGNQLKVVMWPVASLPPGTFANVSDVLNSNNISVGSLLAGKPILAMRMSNRDRGLGVSQLVNDNMRAFSVEVPEATAKSQIIHPEKYVDVIATLTNPVTHVRVSKVIIQNVKVLAVGDSVDIIDEPTKNSAGTSAAERHRNVTLLIPFADEEMLALASREGKIDLALRGSTDNIIQPMSAGTSASRLFGQVQAPEASAPATTSSSSDKPAPRIRARRARPAASNDAAPAIYRVSKH